MLPYESNYYLFFFGWSREPYHEPPLRQLLIYNNIQEIACWEYPHTYSIIYFKCDSNIRSSDIRVTRPLEFRDWRIVHKQQYTVLIT